MVTRLLTRVLRGMALAILLSSFPAAMDCAAQASFQPEREPLRGPHAGAPDSNIRRSELVLAEKVVRQALRYLPGRLRPEDCQVVDDLESLFQGRDPALARQARGYEAFVLGNRYPIFVNLNSPLLRSAVLAYKQEPMANSVFIYLLAAVLAHEQVHAGEPIRVSPSAPLRASLQDQPNLITPTCPDCKQGERDGASSQSVPPAPSPMTSGRAGSHGLKPGVADEWEAYRAELMLLRQFRSLDYIAGDDVDRYIDHVEQLARRFKKQN